MIFKALGSITSFHQFSHFQYVVYFWSTSAVFFPVSSLASASRSHNASFQDWPHLFLIISTLASSVDHGEVLLLGGMLASVTCIGPGPSCEAGTTTGAPFADGPRRPLSMKTAGFVGEDILTNTSLHLPCCGDFIGEEGSGSLILPSSVGGGSTEVEFFFFPLISFVHLFFLGRDYPHLTPYCKSCGLLKVGQATVQHMETSTTHPIICKSRNTSDMPPDVDKIQRNLELGTHEEHTCCGEVRHDDDNISHPPCCDDNHHCHVLCQQLARRDVMFNITWCVPMPDPATNYPSMLLCHQILADDGSYIRQHKGGRYGAEFMTTTTSGDLNLWMWTPEISSNISKSSQSATNKSPLQPPPAPHVCAQPMKKDSRKHLNANLVHTSFVLGGNGLMFQRFRPQEKSRDHRISNGTSPRFSYVVFPPAVMNITHMAMAFHSVTSRLIRKTTPPK